MEMTKRRSNPASAAQTGATMDLQPVKGEHEEIMQCGIGRCHPKFLQRFNKLIFFTINLSVVGFFILLPGPLFSSQV
jgi:hypothetical protein